MARKCAIFTVFLALVAAWVPARDVDRGALALDQSLRDLASDLRAMMVVGRPGEEDLETLALLRRGYGVRTRVVYITRGESSSITPGEAAERAEGDRNAAAARAAAARVGAETRFLGFPDFGPSRSPQEIWGRWGGSDGVRDLVGAVREFRPQLILTTGPGHEDSAYGEVASGFVRQAFAAAGDSSQFPTTGSAFQPLRLYAASEAEDATVRIDVGQLDPVRGESYAEMGFAARSRYLERDAPTPEAISPGPRIRGFRRILPEDAPSGGGLLSGLVTPRPEWLREEKRAGTREEILTRLLRLRAAEDSPPVSPRRMGAAVAAAIGLDLRIRPPAGGLVEDETDEVLVDILNAGARRVRLEALRISSDPGLLPEETALEPVVIEPGGFHTWSFAVAAASCGDPALEVTALFGLDTGEGPFALTRRTTLPVRLAFEGRLRPWDRLIRPVLGRAVVNLEIENRSSQELGGDVLISVEGTDVLTVEAPERIRVGAGQRRLFSAVVETSDDEAAGWFPISFRIGDRVVKDGLRLIDVEVPREVRVAVIRTMGDAASGALQTLGVRARALSDDDLEVLDLANFDTILIGEEPLRRRPVLRRVWPRLLQYIENGGNLVMVSGPGEGWTPSMAPWPLAFGDGRVTEESAPIVIAENDHRLLRFPNRIAAEDFDGWVRERGHRFPEDVSDSEYETVLRVADPGQPLLAALLVAEKGRGTFLQTSLALRLQIENLNPAALKLLANMISYPFRR